MIVILLALCMQLGTLCILLSHLYSAPELLEKACFKLCHNMNAVFSPRIFKRNSGGGGGGGGGGEGQGQALWQGGGRNDY